MNQNILKSATYIISINHLSKVHSVILIVFEEKFKQNLQGFTKCTSLLVEIHEKWKRQPINLISSFVSIKRFKGSRENKLNNCFRFKFVLTIVTDKTVVYVLVPSCKPWYHCVAVGHSPLHNSNQ